MGSVTAALPEKILIVRLGAIGDVVNALVTASALHRAAPHARIGWAVHELSLPLVQGHPAIERVHLWRKGEGLRGFRALLAEVRAERYHLALDLQRLAKSAALARLSGAERVLGFDRARTKEASWLLTRERLAPRAGPTHMVEQYLEFLRHMGVTVEAPCFELPRSQAAEQRAQALVREWGGSPVALHLGATKPANRWEPERFGALARLLIERHAVPVCATGGPSDRELAARARAVEPRLVDLCGATSLLELAELQRRSRTVVSCDSGPMHLAASVGATVVALFGAADERRTGPWGERHRVVRTSPPCAPCNLKHCSQPRHSCMLDLEVERVAAEVGTVLARKE